MFTLYTANRIYELVADNAAEMHMWIGVLSPKKFSQRDDFTCLYRGMYVHTYMGIALHVHVLT